jgi:hypothetical protein
MKITEDRLTVARAVRDEMRNPVFYNGRPRPQSIEKIIESLPEPPDDSPATLPAPTGPDMCAHNAAHTGHTKTEWWWARERKTKVWHMARVAFPRPSPKGDDVLIASPISGFSNTLRNRSNFDAWLPLVAPTAKGGVD